MCINNIEVVSFLFAGYRSGDRRRPEGNRDQTKVSAGTNKLSEVSTLYLSKCNFLV